MSHFQSNAARNSDAGEQRWRCRVRRHSSCCDENHSVSSATAVRVARMLALGQEVIRNFSQHKRSLDLRQLHYRTSIASTRHLNLLVIMQQCPGGVQLVSHSPSICECDDDDYESELSAQRRVEFQPPTQWPTPVTFRCHFAHICTPEERLCAPHRPIASLGPAPAVTFWQRGLGKSPGVEWRTKISRCPRS